MTGFEPCTNCAIPTEPQSLPKSEPLLPSLILNVATTIIFKVRHSLSK